MGKFRSKLKRHTKGKSWGHGQSATTNPENKKHRNKARSRFFQPNLSLAPSNQPKDGGLTLQAVMKHDARQSYKADNAEPTINDIASSFKSFNFNENDGEAAQSQEGTFVSYKTFASNYSACTNMSFSKLLNGFRADSPLHKEMLAILAALTDVIKERGGTQSSTEYFLALMETLDAAKDDNDIIASTSLLSMGIKTVPEAILRRKFSDTAALLLDLMKRFAATDNQNILMKIFSCMSVLLRAQEYSLWTLSSTLEYFDAILSFVLHSKPKIRKAAQHAVTSIIHGSCFMLPPKIVEETTPKSNKITFHPAGNRVAKFCIQQFKPENIANAQALVLHTLVLLRDTLNGFKSDDIKIICEHLLSIMIASNVFIRTNCFHTLHALFSSKTKNLNETLTGKLISALYDYRPEKSDIRQTLAWLTVMKQGHICLAIYDLSMCINALPKLIDICACDLWMSERNEIVTGASNTIKEIFIDCIKLGCETKTLAGIHRVPIIKSINSVTKALSAPFGDVVSQVILIFATVFEITGKYFNNTLEEPLGIIGGRYDVNSSTRIQIEHAILAAIPVMGPESVLKAIPPTDESGEISLDRSWILPLLREAITQSSLEFFTNFILKLASQCNANWKKYKAANNVTLAHTHELLCCQLWGMFPGFCRHPKDIHNFRYIAKTLGTVLNDNPELRAPVLDGLKELMTNADDNVKTELSKFAKNFLPRLFNIYSTKPSGSYENNIRLVALEVIKEYLKITPRDTLSEVFQTAQNQHKAMEAGSFIAESVFDIIVLLVVYQSSTKIKDLFDNFVTAVLQKHVKKSGVAKNMEKLKKQQRKAYELLQNLLTNSNEECIEFVSENLDQIQNLILKSLKTTCNTTQAARLNCLNILIEKQDNISIDNDVIARIIPEVIVTYNHGTNKKDNIGLNLIIKIGELYEKEDKLNDFIDVVMAGFGGDTVLISNTILALKDVVSHFTGSLTVITLQFILEQVLMILVGKHRNEVESSVVFLITFIKVLPSPLVANHLTTIVRSISAMVPDTRRYCRIHIGYILRKLCKKFGAEEIVKLVPGNDEVTHKKLKNIRKEQNRLKRQKIARENSKDDDSSDDDLSTGLEKKSYIIDDILADSDSDLNDDMNDEKPQHKKNKKSLSTYIQEEAESIVDLADMDAIGKITTTKPNGKGLATNTDTKKKPKDANRGFKTAPDGRLIIAEPKRGETMSDSDDEKKDNSPKKRALNDDSDSDEDIDIAAPSRKRKAIEAQSVTSGKTSASSKYVAGGKGIHRPMAASVKSGRSRMSTATTKSASTVYGSEFKAKKAKGDMKKKGKVDPYAYIPLSRNLLNKRKRAKNTGQFKKIVAGARKGAASGTKNKIHKAYKKQK